MANLTGIERAVMVIDAIAEAGGPLRFKHLRQALGGISQSTVSRVLQLLLRAGVLRKTSDQRYALTAKVALWTRGVPQAFDLRLLAAPVLDRLNEALQVTSSLFTAPDGRITCLDRRLDPGSPASGQPGKSFPLDVTKMGSMFFAPPALFRQAAYYPVDLGNGRKLARPRAFLEAWVRETLATDFMCDEGYINPWTGRMAVPIRVRGTTIAVLAIAFPAARLAEEDGFRERAKDLLWRLGKELSKQAELLGRDES